jgi:hypothetical protein
MGKDLDRREWNEKLPVTRTDWLQCKKPSMFLQQASGTISDLPAYLFSTFRVVRFPRLF